MKLLIKQNLSDKLVRRLENEFPFSAHVKLLDMAEAPDLVVWEYARQNGFAILTKDEDYLRLSDTRGHPPKVLYVPLGNCTVDIVYELLRANVMRIQEFDADANEAFLILG